MKDVFVPFVAPFKTEFVFITQPEDGTVTRTRTLAVTATLAEVEIAESPETGTAQVASSSTMHHARPA